MVTLILKRLLLVAMVMCKVYMYEGVMVTSSLSRVLLGVGESCFRGEV